MAGQEDVRRIALALPGTVEDEGHFAFSVLNRGKLKGYAWIWMERIHPKKARVPNPGVLAVRVKDTQQKEMFLATEPALCFTEPHYNGFPAVLLRLEIAEPADLEFFLRNAWRCQAPKELLNDLDLPDR